MILKFSIITVAYNSEKTIAKTIESVLNQEMNHNRPFQIEYLIIDGDSLDETVSVAESYRTKMEEKGIKYRIISEPDEGIFDAMNKGIRLATGDIIGIINSDDWYESCALKTVAETFERTNCELMFANIRLHRADGSCMIKKARLRRFQTSRDWNHPTMFVKASIYKRYPFQQKCVHDDYSCYLQMRRAGVSIVTVDRVLANFRMGGASNRADLKMALQRIRDRYLFCYRSNGYSRLYLLECIFIEAVKMIWSKF